jgi:hypothetical protein
MTWLVVMMRIDVMRDGVIAICRMDRVLVEYTSALLIKCVLHRKKATVIELHYCKFTDY